ncbi:MAG: efflux RND transporter periplasmic adaptor subunit [Alphaproteobacteria bacterium]|nr:efflux RND transporter periplasmic adaptor subunit [Alphaproteobacteria bacterium]
MLPARFAAALPLLLGLAAPPALAGEVVIAPVAKTEYKSIFGQVESRDLAVARARIGGTIMELGVEEGASVKAGDVIATVVDDKLALHLQAMDAHLKELHAQLDNAQTELKRGLALVASGTIAKTQVDGLQTQVNVLTSQVTAAEADRAVILQQGTEGQVLAPAPGRVLSVPVTKGSVAMPGETIARIAGGGYYLRLSLPERHAAAVALGDTVLVGARGFAQEQLDIASARKGKIVKVYPELDSGHVLADVEVDGLGDYFVGERTRVWLSVGQREVIAVPAAAVSLRHGVDFVQVAGSAGPQDVAVIAGESLEGPDGKLVEILSGLKAGDKVITP